VILAESLLADDPAAIIEGVDHGGARGAPQADAGRALAYAAALRVTRFGTANEHSDWETAHHVFTYANAVRQSLKLFSSGPPTAMARSRRCAVCCMGQWRFISPAT